MGRLCGLLGELRRLPVGITLATWLSTHEAELRNNAYLRLKNAVVAYTLLPIFEEEPEGWNTIRKLPVASGSLTKYLEDWHQRVDAADERFIKRLRGILQ